jgi:hypothetical protein
MKLSLPTLYVPLCPLPSLLADDSSKSNFAIHVSGLLSALLVTSFILPLAILPTSLFAGVYFVLFVRYLGVSRDLNRIAATTVSPIFSGFQQVLEGTSPHPSLFPLLTPFIGITTIRAFGRERTFRSTLCILMDDTLSLWYASCTLDVWLSIRTQLLAALCLLTTAWVAVYANVSPGLAGIAITSSLSIIQSLDYLCAAYGKVSISLSPCLLLALTRM